MRAIVGVFAVLALIHQVSADEVYTSVCALASCEENSTCCAYTNVTRCCPRSKAICCPDSLYCCPQGTKCTCTHCPGSQCDCSSACARAHPIGYTATSTALPMANHSDSRTDAVPGSTPYPPTIDRRRNTLNDTRFWLGAGLVVGVPLIGLVAWRLGRRVYTFWSASRVHRDVPHAVV